MDSQPADDDGLLTAGETEAQAVLGQLRSIERATPEFIKECLTLFIAQTGLDLADLQATIEKGDAPEVARIAHRLKGSCATAGAVGMQARCERIEALARSGTLDSANSQYLLLVELFHSLSDSLSRQ
jgi:HPt (histidine-containing phosphotransfer) domain-containing protein